MKTVVGKTVLEKATEIFAQQQPKVVEPSITFNIGVERPFDFEYLYICGSIGKLGNWDPSKAIRIKRSKRGAFTKTIKLPIGTKFEFKILKAPHWGGVEKGFYWEELPNRYAEVVEVKNKKIVEVKNLLF